MSQISEVQMCDTRDLGVKWPHWHTLMCSDETKIDMRFVCSRDVKNLTVCRGRSVKWKKWTAKHEHEELKEGERLEPALALLRKKVQGDWTEKHCNVARKIFLEGGWTQKRLFDFGWSDVSFRQAYQMVEAQALPLSGMARDQEGDSAGLQKVGSKRRERRRESGSGKEVSSRTLPVKANGTEATSV